MAAWNSRRGLEVAAMLRNRWPERWASLSGRLVLDDAELTQWQTVAETLVTGLDPKTGLFEQFAGFYGLENVDLAEYEGRTVSMDVVLGRSSGKAPSLPGIGSICCLSLVACTKSLATTSRLPAATAAWAL